MKKIAIYFIVTIVVGSLIFFGIQYMSYKKYQNTDDNRKINTIEQISYDKLNDLINKNGKYILFISSDNDTSDIERKEILYVLKYKDIIVYELKTKTLNNQEYLKIIDYISNKLDRDDNYLLTPTLIYKNNDKEYLYEGLINSDKIIEQIDKYNIE